MRLGIDHALVATRDIEATRRVYMGLGFANRGFSQHPWGTATTLMIFPGQLFEIVGISDADLLDLHEAGGFRFGRHVAEHLARREGVALTALNSADAEGVARDWTDEGMAVAGLIRFGRDVTRADGTPDRTSTTLAVAPCSDMPRLSVFACQQHRRDLIELPAWMVHPNGTTGIAGLTVLAAPGDVAAAARWLSRVHASPVQPGPLGPRIATPSGAWSVATPDAFAAAYGALPFVPDTPAIAGIDLRTPTPEAVTPGGLATHWHDDLLCLPGHRHLGGVCLRFGAF